MGEIDRFYYKSRHSILDHLYLVRRNQIRLNELGNTVDSRFNPKVFARKVIPIALCSMKKQLIEEAKHNVNLEVFSVKALIINLVDSNISFSQKIKIYKELKPEIREIFQRLAPEGVDFSEDPTEILNCWIGNQNLAEAYIEAIGSGLQLESNQVVYRREKQLICENFNFYAKNIYLATIDELLNQSTPKEKLKSLQQETYRLLSYQEKVSFIIKLLHHKALHPSIIKLVPSKDLPNIMHHMLQLDPQLSLDFIDQLPRDRLVEAKETLEKLSINPAIVVNSNNVKKILEFILMSFSELEGVKLLLNLKEARCLVDDRPLIYFFDVRIANINHPLLIAFIHSSINEDIRFIFDWDISLLRHKFHQDHPEDFFNYVGSFRWLANREAAEKFHHFISQNIPSIIAYFNMDEGKRFALFSLLASNSISLNKNHLQFTLSQCKIHSPKFVNEAAIVCIKNGSEKEFFTFYNLGALQKWQIANQLVEQGEFEAVFQHKTLLEINSDEKKFSIIESLLFYYERDPLTAIIALKGKGSSLIELDDAEYEIKVLARLFLGVDHLHFLPSFISSFKIKENNYVVVNWLYSHVPVELFLSLLEQFPFTDENFLIELLQNCFDALQATKSKVCISQFLGGIKIIDSKKWLPIAMQDIQVFGKKVIPYLNHYHFQRDIALDIIEFLFNTFSGIEHIDINFQSTLAIFSKCGNVSIAAKLLLSFIENFDEQTILQLSVLTQNKSNVILPLILVAKWQVIARKNEDNSHRIDMVTNEVVVVVKALTKAFKNGSNPLFNAWVQLTIDLDHSRYTPLEKIQVLHLLCLHRKEEKISKDFSRIIVSRISFINLLLKFQREADILQIYEKALSTGEKKVDEPLKELLLEHCTASFASKFSYIENFKQLFLDKAFSLRDPVALIHFANDIFSDRFDEDAHKDMERFIRSILNNSYKTDRYKTQDSEHLTLLSTRFPDIYREWQKNFKSITMENFIYAKGAVEQFFSHTNHLLVDQLDLDGVLTQSIVKKRQMLLDLQRMENPSDLETAQQLILHMHMHPKEISLAALNQLLSLLKKLSEIDERLINHIQEFIHETESQLSLREKFTITETDHYEDMLLSGSSFGGSCQSVYDLRTHKQALLSYLMDGKNKGLFLKDSQGNLIARHIVRLLWDPIEEKPALFVESLFSHYKNKEIQETLLQYARKRAKSLGCSLFITRLQTSYGKEVESYLVSMKSSCSLDYSDSARKPRCKQGAFKVEGIYQVSLDSA